MTDHPLFPEMQDEAKNVETPAQPEEPTPTDEAVVCESIAAQQADEQTFAPEPVGELNDEPAPVAELTDEPELPVVEPVAASAEEPVAQEPIQTQQTYAQPQYIPYQPQSCTQTPYMQQPAYNGYVPYAPQPPVQQAPTQPKFDPYTGKRIAPKKEKKPKKNGGFGWRLAVFGLCIALIGGLVGGLIGFALAPDEPAVTVKEPQAQVTQTPTEKPTQKPAGNMQPPANLSELYEAAVPTIVGVLNEFTTYNYFGQASTSTSTGTGFIISSDGEILTNYHVIEGAQKLTVTMYDGTEYPAEILGYEAESDVALIKVEATDLPAVTMGDSDALMVGEQITAIGNPLGELTHTMTVGYVSAKSRAVYTDEMPINMMQIDAAINPGNSGGPLFNLNGEVVGITTAKYSGTLDGSATIEGIGFAIPINDVLAIVDDLREFGSVQNRAYMGVTVTNNVAGGDLPAGAMVQSIEKGSPAYMAGMRLGDIIVGVGETKVYGVDTLYQALRPYRGGDSAEVTVFRSGETLKLTITFAAAPKTEEPTEVPTETEPTTDAFGFPWDYFFP